MGLSEWGSDTSCTQVRLLLNTEQEGESSDTVALHREEYTVNLIYITGQESTIQKLGLDWCSCLNSTC